MVRRTIINLAIVVALLALGTTIVVAGNGSLAGNLERTRGALARFNSLEQATAAGYVPGSPCEESPAGGMGIHYVNPSLMGPGIDPLRPEILLYAPDSNGNLKLVGVEYFQADADQDLGTDSDRPTLFGQAFDGPMAGHGPGMPIHYDLHVWLFEANPSGTFAIWNPAVSCS
jgi:hypothetical protein